MDMMEKIKKRKEMDKAVNEENMEKINSILCEIPDVSPKIDVNSFKNSIKRKEVKNMKKRALKITAVLVAAISVSVCAAAAIKHFSFIEDGKYVIVSSNADLSKEEAEKIAKQQAEEFSNTVPSEENIVHDYDNFDNIEQAEKAYDMIVPLPEKMPDLELNDISGIEMMSGENSKESTLWLVYGDPDEKAFGITVVKYDFKDNDITSVTETDTEYSDEFVSDKGYKFTVLKDNDEESGRCAEIYEIEKGIYRYCLVFAGFEKDEIIDVVNSTDLTQYN